KRVAALGLAFKPDVDDLRESPAIEVVHLLLKAGTQVTVYEPFKTDFTIPGARTAATLSEAIAGVDALLLLVGHSQLNGLDPAEVAKMTRARVAVDMVNGWQPADWQAAGFDIYRLGVGSEHES
ncbi:MAG: UDP-glucose/GDP-mannose dehydrogenase family protein, partial [Bellilinea sp.]